MGAGKSTTAELAATRLGLTWYDVDTLVEQSSGLAVAEIFRRQGEAWFRDAESRTFRTLIETVAQPFVVAAGGGAPLRAATADLLSAWCAVVWLDGDPVVLYQRAAGPERPLMPADVSAFVQLWETRRPVYERLAHVRIDVTTCDAKSAAALAADWWKDWS